MISSCYIHKSGIHVCNCASVDKKLDIKLNSTLYGVNGGRAGTKPESKLAIRNNDY